MPIGGLAGLAAERPLPEPPREVFPSSSRSQRYGHSRAVSRNRFLGAFLSHPCGSDGSGSSPNLLGPVHRERSNWCPYMKLDFAMEGHHFPDRRQAGPSQSRRRRWQDAMPMPNSFVVSRTTGHRGLSRRRYCNPIQFHSESPYQRDSSSPAKRLKCLCPYPVSRSGADSPSGKQPDSWSPTESKHRRRPVLCLQTSDCLC
jgi:hypothetical protein